MYNVIYTLYVFMHILEIQCTTCSIYKYPGWDLWRWSDHTYISFSLHFRGIITLDQASSLTTTIFDQAKTTLKPKSQQVFEDRRRQLKVIVDTTIQELQTLTIRYTPHPPTLLWNIHCTFIMFVWYKMKMPYWNKILFTLLFIQHRYMYVMWDLLQFKSDI